MKRQKIVVFLLCIFTFTSAHALTLYTAKEALELAVTRNPDLRALKLDFEGQRAFERHSRNWDDPQFDLSVERRDESVGATDFGKIQISQFIPRPGRLKARHGIAQSVTEQRSLELELSEKELRRRVLQLLFNYRVAVEKSAHAKERFDRFKTIEAYLRSRPFASPQKQTESLIVRSKLAILQKQLRELESHRQIAWIQLNLYLGLPDDSVVTVGWYQTLPQFKYSELFKKAEQQNPQLREQAIRFAMQGHEVTASRVEAWPGFSLIGSFSNGTGASPEKNYGLGVSFPLPIFHGNRGSIQMAESHRLAEQERAQWIRQNMEQNLKSALEHYDSIRRSADEMPIAGIAELEREMQLIDKNFKKGQIDLITYLEADTQHVEHLNLIFDVQTDALAALSELLKLTDDVPHPPVEI